jgi:hypothetical protein
MSRPRIDRAARAIAAAVALGALLGGCSDLYTDRRETIALGADNAVAANMVEQMVDPWPRYSNDKNIPFNGERMQRAVQCYRADKVTQPTDLDTSLTAGSTPPPATGALCEGQMNSGSAQAAIGAPVAAATAK